MNRYKLTYRKGTHEQNYIFPVQVKRFPSFTAAVNYAHQKAEEIAAELFAVERLD